MPAMVVIPTNGFEKRRVAPNKIQAILSNRVVGADEQYLIQWKTNHVTVTPPLSWHSIGELIRCLDEVQEYLEERTKLAQDKPVSRKRKSPDAPSDIERRPSPFERRLHLDSRTPAAPRSSSSIASVALGTADTYNGVLDADDNGYIFCRPLSGPNIASLEVHYGKLPVEMKRAALKATTTTALTYIQSEYERRLKKVPGAPIRLFNDVDRSTPSLRFKYISEYVLREGVHRASTEAQVGCQNCSPHMGRNIGCEYTKKCDCLEYAAVDEARITDPGMMAQYEDYKLNGGDSMGFPKKFPYFAEGTKVHRTGSLVPFYLNSRRPIYECNDKCKCGPYCRNKNVQFGRTVEVEIFRTDAGRGWGLRCLKNLHEGQFIDTYRGEVITDAEATRREEASNKAKASYLYSLDKFADTENLSEEEIYVVDGEFMGGPTKFINHCCEPNCRQYTVSYNKHDCKVYDIAFFACRFIPAGEELTFDYLDKDEGEDQEMEEPGEGAIPCLCGAKKCRKWLWT